MLESLKELCALGGISGDEGEVREYILSHVRATSITKDAMGNLICYKKGTKNSQKKVMVCAHMDEVGLIVSSITEDGFLKFKSVGGIDPRVLYSKAVYVGKSKIPGVICGKAVHLQKKEERKKKIPEKDLYIDIGASSKEEAEDIVSLGDSVIFASEFTEFGEGKVKAKALDDRCGCAVLIELLKEDYPFDFYGVFTTQEEVGLRGAKVSAARIMPDACLVLEGTTCSDVYKTEEKDMVTRLGEGVALTFMDRGIIVNRTLLDEICNIAREENIPFQFKKTTMGGTDAGAVHLSGVGVPTAVLAVPCRYLHSPSLVMHKGDFVAMAALAKAVLKRW